MFQSNFLKSTNQRLFVVLIAVIILLFITIIVQNSRAEVLASQRLFEEQAKGNVNYIASLIDPKVAEEMYKAMDINSPASLKIRVQLDQLLANNPNISLAYIHGIKPTDIENNRTTNLGIPTVLMEFVTVGTPYDQTQVFMKALKETLITKKPATTEIYEDTFGTWMSALIALPSPDGQSVHMVLGIDQDATQIVKGNRAFYQNMWVIGLIFMALSLILFLSYRIYNRNTYLNEKIAQSNQALEKQMHRTMEAEKLSALGGLVSGVAHEMNTPLGVAITAATFLDDRLQHCQRAFNQKELTRNALEEYLSIAHETSTLLHNNLTHVAQLIQSFKLIAAEQGIAEASEVSAGQLLESIWIMTKHKVNEDQVTVSLDYPQDLVITTDVGALIQVVTNLLSNCFEHAPLPHHHLHVKLAIAADKDGYKLTVDDDGAGIAPGILSKIYDPFFTTKGSSGLGLSIVYNAVTTRLQGQIQVTSSPGKGTTFTITF